MSRLCILAFAAVALGIVADQDELPWNTILSVDLNYTAAPATLYDQAGFGSGADQLNIEVTHVERPLAGLADHREGLRQQVIEATALLVTATELLGLGGQRGVVQRAGFRLQRIDAVDGFVHGL